MPPDPILEVENLSVSFVTDGGRASVVEEVSFAIQPGETVGLVGESGCGKSVTAMSIMRLIPSPPSRVESGRILFQGDDLLALDNGKMRAVRGDRISMIFQEPMTSLNPTFSIGYQIAEVFRIHRAMGKAEAWRESADILGMVGIGAAERRLHQYPHELSGGLRQRAMIAMALACRPDLLIADEPTTALDVTVQAQILDLLRRLRGEIGMSVLLISHDLGVIAEVCERVLVMYAGRIVEAGTRIDILANARHPYTQGLLRSVPSLGRRGERLDEIAGVVPQPRDWPAGCRFSTRCTKVLDLCRREVPGDTTLSPSHTTRCHVVAEEVS